MTGRAAMRFLPVNLDALLVELEDLESTLALLASLQAEPIAGILELVPAARTLLVRYLPTAVSHAELAAQIAARSGLPPPAERALATVKIPVDYRGEDLDEVAALLGVSREEVVRRHTGSDYAVAFTGFAPGFAYLSGGDPGLHVPRRKTPRTRIPAGAVALGGAFSGVYPQASPGGWQIIGVTDVPMWDLTRHPPALLQPGARVRFVDVTGRQRAMSAASSATSPTPPVAPEAIVATSPAVAAAAASKPLASSAESGMTAATFTAATTTAPTLGTVPPDSGSDYADAAAGGSALAADDDRAARLVVQGTGLQALFQDLGRPGQAGQGVSASGAMDRAALRAANRLVGNPVGTVCVEAVYGGLDLVCRGAGVVVAVTGADLPVTLTTAAGARRSLPTHTAIALDPGERLCLGEPEAGIRGYVAVRGGFAVAPVLGSCSTDTLAHIGPPAIKAGDVLRVGPAATPGGIVAAPGEPAEDLPTTRQTVVLDIVLGPRSDWFTAPALALLTSQVWTVTPQSNRVGLRLAGDTPLARANPAELPSEGTAKGAIQVPASGQPVLFLADHPLTGGYPVIASVARHHLDRAGQVPVGARIRFQPIHHPGLSDPGSPLDPRDSRAAQGAGGLQEPQNPRASLDSGPRPDHSLPP